MEFKFIIICPQTMKLNNLIEYISNYEDNFIVAKKFTNDITYKDTENKNGLFYLDSKTITESLKNNSILYISNDNGEINGITVDDFYNGNVIPMSIKNFNNISTNFINKYKDDILLVWLDTKTHTDNKLLNKDILEVNYLIEKINNDNFNYIYFLDEPVNVIGQTIIDYYFADDNEKHEILEKYS